LQLEKKVSKEAKDGIIKKNHILDIAEWGCLRNKDIKCPEELYLFENRDNKRKIKNSPIELIKILESEIEGFGPTYLSKVLRFAFPSKFGAIDTRIVRVLGDGDSDSKQKNWFSLKAINRGNGWYINRKNWLEGYSRWISILRFLKELLNKSKFDCPHPKAFLTENLRSRDVWACADVEMTLFSYASKHINSNMNE